MKTRLTVSLLALAVVAFATPSEAQTRRGGNGSPGFSAASGLSASGVSGRFSSGPVTQRSIGQRFISKGSLAQAGSGSSHINPRSLSGPRPPVGTNLGSNTVQPRTFSGPRPPVGTNLGSNTVQPRAFSGPRPPVNGGSVISSGVVPTAAVATAVGAGALVASSQTASASASDTAVLGAPIGPDPVQVAGATQPPQEMLAPVGAPIVPLVAAATLPTSKPEGRLVRVRTAEESCTPAARRIYRSHRSH